MLTAVRQFFTRLFQPISSSQYFTGVKLFNNGDYEGAAEALQLVRQGVYKTSILYSSLAMFYLHRSLRNAALISFYNKDYIRCIQHCKEALIANPEDRVCRNYLAHAYHHVGQYGASIKQLRKLKEAEGERIDMRLNLAKILIKSDSMDEAIEILNNLIETYKSYPDFFLVLGIAHSKKGDSDGAVEYFKTAIDINPQFASAYLLMGLEQVLTTDYVEAHETFRRGIQSSPENTDLLFYFGLTGSLLSRLEGSQIMSFLKKNEIETPDDFVNVPDDLLQDLSFIDYRAVQERYSLLELDISYGEHFTFLDPIYDSPCLNSLIDVFESLTDSFPKYADYYYKLATFYIKAGNIEKAERHLLKALDINPQYIDALSDLASVYESENQLEQSLSLTDTILELAPDSAEHNLSRGRILVKLEQYAEATRSMRKAQELDSRYNYHLYLLGHILAEKEQFPLAHECWTIVKEFMPKVSRDLKRLRRKERRASA